MSEDVTRGWHTARRRRLALTAGGAGLVPVTAMLRHRADAGGDVAAHALVSARALEDSCTETSWSGSATTAWTSGTP